MTAASRVASPATIRSRVSAPSKPCAPRTKAVTVWPWLSACMTVWRPVPPVAPKTSRFNCAPGKSRCTRSRRGRGRNRTAAHHPPRRSSQRKKIGKHVRRHRRPHLAITPVEQCDDEAEREHRQRAPRSLVSMVTQAHGGACAQRDTHAVLAERLDQVARKEELFERAVHDRERDEHWKSQRRRGRQLVDDLGSRETGADERP